MRSRRPATMLSGLAVLVMAATAAAAEATPEPTVGPFAHDDLAVVAGMRTVCVAGRDGAASVKACFDVYPYQNETDAGADYRIWRFLGRGAPVGDSRVSALSVGLRSSVGEIVYWDPGQDLVVEHTGPVPIVAQDDRAISATGVGAPESPQRFRSLPGTVRPPVGEADFTVSWTATAGGFRDTAEVGGSVLWKVPQGAPPVMAATLSLRAASR